jgi:transposase-like protein
MAADPKTLQEAFIYFADPKNCNEFLAGLRWPDGKVRCPYCNSDKVVYLATQNRYKCYGKHPKAQFSLKVGTVFEDSPISLDKWLCGMWLLVNCKNGISSCEMGRHLGISQKSAWFLDHRIRMALHDGTIDKANGLVLYSDFDHIIRSIVLDEYCGRRLVVLYSANGSGNPRDHEIVTVAGCVAEIDRWTTFKQGCAAIMVEAGLPAETVFHMTDFSACNPPFDIFKADPDDEEEKVFQAGRKAAFLTKIVECITNNISKAFSVGVVVAEYQRLNRDYQLVETFGHEYAFCGLMCVKFTLEWGADNKIDHPIKFFFERGEPYQSELDRGCKSFFGFEPECLSKQHAPFQAGDVIAWKNRRALIDAVVHGPTRNLDILNSIERSNHEIESLKHFYGVYGREELTHLCRSTKTWEIPKRLILPASDMIGP